MYEKRLNKQGMDGTSVESYYIQEEPMRKPLTGMPFLTFRRIISSKSDFILWVKWICHNDLFYLCNGANGLYVKRVSGTSGKVQKMPFLS